MADRDPFPMSSPEAQRLAASVEPPQSSSDGGTASSNNNNNSSSNNNWNSMNTQSAHRGPRSDQELNDAARKRLVKSGNKKTKAAAPQDWAYADADAPEDDEDDFLDRPLWESRTKSWFERHFFRGVENVYKRLYGDKLPPAEMLRTLCLASTLFFMIGGYWLLRSLKDAILTALCGVSVIPKAKMLSVFVVLGVVSIYNCFLDSSLPKHVLFYIFGTFYFGVFTIISFLLMHPTIGLANQQHSPSRILGWVSYCAIESFGSVMVSLFWSFANSNITLETAKASYGVMVAAAQVGSILGPTIVSTYTESLGLAKLYLVGACCMLLLQGTMRFYVRTYGVAEDNPDKTEASSSKPKKAGILEGLVLFAKYNYVKGIFAISCLFMVEVTIVDFTMKLLAREYFADEFPCTYGMSCYNAATGEHGLSDGALAAFAKFMGFFGQATNTLSFLLSLFGTSAVIRFLGLRLTLLLFPSLCLGVIIFVRFQPTLYVVFGAMMMLKACSYALNNPTKEMLYQPTSAAVRYKAKSWIDIFGARGSKALGSLVTNAFSDSAATLVSNGSLVGMAVASFLIWNARFMGQKFEEYTTTGYTVGQDDSDENAAPDQEHIELATAQNEHEDTSCAIYEDAGGMYKDADVGLDEEGQSQEESESTPPAKAEKEKTAEVTMV